ncbi:hypothetical protein N7475_009982 [Penicillium sp. IBT 31633x]|nr:hypothetical protein N7475_009982 [Penicillium sp. IBT 31633x]
MARLTDDSQQDAAVNSTEILSPQPFTPQEKGFLVSSLESNNETYRHDNVQMPSTQDYEYNSSSSSARHSTSDVFGREMDDELDQLKSRASSRSSLSSTPASVLIHSVDRMKQMPDMDIHEKIAGYRIEQSEASFGDFNDTPANIRTIRQREAAFRKPSSVRAMQMHTEDEADEDDYLTPPRRRQGIRSPGSLPLKRSPYYSPNAPKQQKSKKEAPLVLLHCTLLPPSLPVPGASDPRNQDILEDELPPEYWRRWRRLQDRVGSGVLRDRGVLISHPEDLYDMLEERLLESLELQRPRLQNGHFVGREDHSSGSCSEDDFSDFGESETDGEQGDECPDCGNHVRHGDSNRKWEIRVFAANGLMRAGAWAAAWRDMEKVDVEVGLWLPSEVRRGLERRFAEAQMAVAEQVEAEAQAHGQIPQTQMQMQISSLVDGENQVLPEILQSPRQSHARMISDVGSFRSDGMVFRQVLAEAEAQLDPAPEFTRENKKEHEVALSTLLVNYIRILATDRRNIALLLLSVLVAFLAFGSRQQQVLLYSDLGSFPRDMSNEIMASPAIPSLSLAPSLSPSASSLHSVDAGPGPISRSVGSVLASEPPSAAESEMLPLPTETEDPGSPSSGFSLTHTLPTDSVEPAENMVPSQLPETVQPQPDETAFVSALSADAVKSPDESEASLKATESMQSQPEDTAEASSTETVDSSILPVETENPHPKSSTDYSSTEAIELPTMSSEHPSAASTIETEESMESTETMSAPPEGTAETSPYDTEGSAAVPADSILSSPDSVESPSPSDAPEEPDWLQSEAPAEENKEEEEEDNSEQE